MEEFERIQQKNQYICEKTFIRKEQFIDMLQKLDFVAIESAKIDFIAMFKIDIEKDNVEPKGFRLELS